MTLKTLSFFNHVVESRLPGNIFKTAVALSEKNVFPVVVVRILKVVIISIMVISLMTECGRRVATELTILHSGIHLCVACLGR